MNDSFYDRLPLEMAQVLRDATEWRTHVLNDRAECAVSALGRLAESTDALYKWEVAQETTDRVTHITYSRMKKAPVPKLRLVTLDDKDKS